MKRIITLALLMTLAACGEESTPNTTPLESSDAIQVAYPVLMELRFPGQDTCDLYDPEVDWTPELSWMGYVAFSELNGQVQVAIKNDALVSQLNFQDMLITSMGTFNDFTIESQNGVYKHDMMISIFERAPVSATFEFFLDTGEFVDFYNDGYRGSAAGYLGSSPFQVVINSDTPCKLNGSIEFTIQDTQADKSVIPLDLFLDAVFEG